MEVGLHNITIGRPRNRLQNPNHSVSRLDCPFLATVMDGFKFTTDVEKVEKENEEYLKKLSVLLESDCFERGKKESCHQLGEFYQVVTRNIEKAKEVLQKNCEERNFADSCFNLGYLLFSPKDKDVSESLRLFNKACDGDSLGACNNAALVYQSGHKLSNIEQDMDRAVSLFEKACLGGFRNSCFSLSTIYLTGRNGISKDIAKAIHYSESSCRDGHPWACANLSRIYAIGDGVEKDPKKAEEYKARAKQLKTGK